MKINNEQGIFVILTSVIALAIISGLILLGTNTFLIRAASSDLRTRADEVCTALIHSETKNYDELLLGFKTYVESISNIEPGGLTKLTKAKLIIPSMPESEDFNAFLANQAESTYLKLQNGSIVSQTENFNGIAFADLGLEACQSQHFIGTDCTLQTDVNRLGTNNISGFPTLIWNNVDNTINTIGCELEGEVSLFLDPLSPRIISGRSIFQSTTRGDFSEYRPYHLGDFTSENKAAAPGITLAISTHLTTKASNIIFNFPTLNNPPGWTTDKQAWWEGISGPELYDFNYTLPPYPAPPFPSFANSSLQHDTTEVISGNPIFFEVPLVPTNQNEIKELLISCSNPLVLVRNAFLTSLTELASRNGELRSKFEILNVGTQDRNITSLNSLPSIRREPSVITTFGSDLLKKDYQTPMLTNFNLNVDVSLQTELGSSFGPELNPFTTNLDVNNKKIHALIANQTRFCQHLYWGATTNPPLGLAAPITLRRYQGGPDIWASSENFEPPYFISEFTSLIRSTNPTANWDQNCPYGIATSTCANPEAENLAASQVMSILGSSQICPFEFSGCTKPQTDGATGTYDLRPDYLGLLEYLQTSNAFKSPGLFPIDRPQNRVTASNTKTALILVTHQRLSAGEITEIENIIRTWPDRHVTVVWFSADSASIINQGVADFKQAFQIGSEANPAANQLYVFSPFYGDNNISRYQSYPENERLLYYWMDLLNPDDENYIVRKAVLVYNSKLINKRKF